MASQGTPFDPGEVFEGLSQPLLTCEIPPPAGHGQQAFLDLAGDIAHEQKYRKWRNILIKHIEGFEGHSDGKELFPGKFPMYRGGNPDEFMG